MRDDHHPLPCVCRFHPSCSVIVPTIVSRPLPKRRSRSLPPLPSPLLLLHLHLRHPSPRRTPKPPLSSLTPPAFIDDPEILIKHLYWECLQKFASASNTNDYFLFCQKYIFFSPCRWPRWRFLPRYLPLDVFIFPSPALTPYPITGPSHPNHLIPFPLLCGYIKVEVHAWMNSISVLIWILYHDDNFLSWIPGSLLTSKSSKPVCSLSRIKYGL